MRRLGGRVVLASLVLLGLSSCVPLTFSRDAAIDFEVYQSVAVEVFLGGDAIYYGQANASAYLARELRDGSGFQSVTTDVSAEVDLVLSVQLVMFEVVTYVDGAPDIQYDGHASFTAFDQQGVSVDSGRVADASSFPSETIEDVLDEVALRYLTPYRL